MEVGCFPLDSNGFEIVEFTDPHLDRSSFLLFHRCITFCMCFIGLATNLLLITIIVVNHHLLCNLREIVLIGSILETLNCFVNFLTIPFLYSTRGRILIFANHGLHFSDQSVNSLLLGITITSTVCYWNFSTFQFVYRLHLVTHGTTPRSWRFFLYMLIPIVSSLIYGYCSLSGMNLFEKPNEQVVENRELILKHFGFSISGVEVVETLFVNKKKKSVDSIFGLTMLINYFIIAYCSIQIRRTLRAGSITSATTRRMNRDMDRVLMFNALIPIFSNVFPSSYMHYAISKCDDYPWLGLIDTCMINSLFIFSPISIIHFVRPYRRTVQQWFGFIGNRRLTITETSGSVANLTQRHVKGRPVFYVRKLSITPITL